jgi:hypothetical protein
LLGTSDWGALSPKHMQSMVVRTLFGYFLSPTCWGRGPRRLTDEFRLSPLLVLSSCRVACVCLAHWLLKP